MIYWKYFWVVVRHKWYVLLAGLDLKVPIINLLFHDYDKFFPTNFITYANYIVDHKNKEGFQRSWNYHQKRNKHHWNYWVLIDGYDDLKVLKIPNNDRLELVSDWIAAGKVYGTPIKIWYEQNKEKILLHPDSRNEIEKDIRNFVNKNGT